MRMIDRVPPPAYFAVSAVFHYLGPAFAVLLFAHVPVPGVAWLRIAGAALVFAIWCRPWRLMSGLDRPQLGVLVALGAVLAAMNTVFYLAIARLPLATVGAIEFLGVIMLAAVGIRGRRNAVALVLAVAGVVALTDVRIVAEPLGIALAFANCALFVLYVVLGHRIAGAGRQGVDRLAAAMLIAAVVAVPVGIGPAAAAFTHPGWLLAGIGVGICSSVIPYVTDQLAMARLPRATFALMLSILPATATVIGMLVLAQLPTPQELTGLALVIAGVAIHQQEENPCSTPGSARRASRSRGSVSA
ncbi:MAG TPA: EamA family transporter [Actinophytocola sp.]|uniref:EamA family transporter n=1 Tax=Actinophytocola sp. TaxID=1872138 RepID=UPI002DBFCD5F|nr:EamA family transporter [Actinophytocola sp.]HEU5469060.1 EamA family transporter [Actinophytocola sp.]